MDKIYAKAREGGWILRGTFDIYRAALDKEFWQALAKASKWQINQASARARRFCKWAYHYGVEKAVEDLEKSV